MVKQLSNSKLQNIYDLALKAGATLSLEVKSSYYEMSKKNYYTYEDKKTFEKFVAKMTKEHRESYEKGGGSELMEKDAPPKMASYASSSRFIYLLGKDIPNFTFEAKRHTRIGGTANLDGFLHCDKEDVYVEAKCHEMFQIIKVSDIKENYIKLYRYLETQSQNHKFEFTSEGFICNGRHLTRFDLKQMICHMLGIAQYMLKQSNKAYRQKVNFIYLTHELTTTEKEYLLGQGEGVLDQIERILQTEIEECKTVDFAWLWSNIINYLYNELPRPKHYLSDPSLVEQMKSLFSFTNCNQNNFKQLVTKSY